jgi:small-conductance mechanosensitive channel
MDDSRFAFIESIDRSLRSLTSPDTWWQGGVIIAAAAVAWLGARAARRGLVGRVVEGTDVSARVVDILAHRIMPPATFGLLCLVGGGLLGRLGLPDAAASAAGVLALALAGIRLFVDAIKRLLQPGPLLIASEHLITWFVWIVVALYLLGWTGVVTEALDGISIPVGRTRFSLLDMTKALLTMLVFLAVAGYLGSVATRGIMSASEVSIGVRVGVAKVVRLLLIVISALLALQTVGIDLAALTVFGGALGIGLGFGLQRIAANFVSGFILIGDRSIRQNDVITIGDRFGVVKELRARYIVVRDRDGVDTLIPNEHLISTEVVNWSYASRAIRLKLPVQISYEDQPREALALLVEAAKRHPRVQKSPPPVSRVMGFGDSGIDLELRFWIEDPEDGINNVRSDLYLEIWDLFAAAGITIPYPQRDLHLRGQWPGTAPERLPPTSGADSVPR